MKKATLLIAFSALLTAHAAFASDIYFIDKHHSNMGFLIRHLFTKVPGRFTDFSGQISFDEANPEQSTVEVTIKTASVNTDNDERDKDLRSPNFFDVEKFPQITFRSKSVKLTGQNTAEVTGDFDDAWCYQGSRTEGGIYWQGQGGRSAGDDRPRTRCYDDGDRMGCDRDGAAQQFWHGLEPND